MRLRSVNLTLPEQKIKSLLVELEEHTNRLTSLTDFGSRQFTFSYDALGRRTSLTRPNGVDTSYTYDTLSRVLSILHQLGGTTLDGVNYTYDTAGNRTSKTALPSNVASNYSYDPGYQLTQVMQGTTRTEAYTYDAVGNRTYQPGAPYTYNNSKETSLPPSPALAGPLRSSLRGYNAP